MSAQLGFGYDTSGCEHFGVSLRANALKKVTDRTIVSSSRLKSDLAKLPEGGAPADGKKSLAAFAGQTTNGLNVEIIQKDTRSTAISMGMPLPVTREHPDFPALNLARVWLGDIFEAFFGSGGGGAFGSSARPTRSQIPRLGGGR